MTRDVANDESLHYFAKGDGPGSYHFLFFKTGSWGTEYEWHQELSAWKTTTRLMDMLYKMELSLDQLTYEEARSEFPDAFPVKLSEEGQKLNEPSQKKIIYIDMDNVLVDFKTGIQRIPPKILNEMPKDRDGNPKDLDEIDGIFGLMDPMHGAIEAFKLLDKHHHVYILSTAPWKNHSAWSDKVAWVQRYIGKVEGEPAYKRLILSHNKHLNTGDFLIDDRLANGADKFNGEHIFFGEADPDEKRPGDFPTWQSVIEHFVARELLPKGSQI